MDTGQRFPNLSLLGWSRARRVMLLRRRLPEDALGLVRKIEDGQGELFWAESSDECTVWEFAVQVTQLNLKYSR